MMLKRFFTKPLELLSTYPTCAAPATTPLEVESKGFAVKVVSVTSFSIRLILLFFTSFHFSSSRYFAHHSLGKVCGLAPSSRVHFVFSLVLTFRTEIALYGLDCKSSSTFFLDLSLQISSSTDAIECSLNHYAFQTLGSASGHSFFFWNVNGHTIFFFSLSLGSMLASHGISHGCPVFLLVLLSRPDSSASIFLNVEAAKQIGEFAKSRRPASPMFEHRDTITLRGVDN